jgi:zinc protease
MSKVFAFDYDQHDFPNGLRLISVPAPYPNVVALYIVVQAGSRNEVEPGKTGFAHFFEHMMFRGTPSCPPAKYEAVIQETGASSNAYTDDDRTVYHTTLSKEDFETVLALEADRFRNLSYSVEDFQTEALAVYGEYNKDFADPLHKMFEVLRDISFDVHTYKHTTMGFLPDIIAMPQQYAYSRTFFDRYYRPEYTTLVVVGDIEPSAIRAQVDRHWGSWTRGAWTAPIPAEPPQAGPREAAIPWETPTLPHLLISWRSAAYSDSTKDCAALDLITFLGFSESSPLYQKLIIEDQTVDTLWASNSDHVDPYLFSVFTRVKEQGTLPAVRAAIEQTLDGFRDNPIDEATLDAVKKRLRYQFALGMNNSDSIASTLAHYVSLRRTPETINRLYEAYDSLTAGDLQSVAQRYFTASGRTVVTLEAKS